MGRGYKKKRKEEIGKRLHFRDERFLSEDAGFVSFRLPGAASTDDSLVRRAKIWERPASSLTLLRRKTVALGARGALPHGSERRQNECGRGGRGKRNKKQKQPFRSKCKNCPNSGAFFKARHPLSYTALEALQEFAAATSHKTTSKTTAKRPHARVGSASSESAAAAAATAAAYDCNINKSTQQRCCR